MKILIVEDDFTIVDTIDRNATSWTLCLPTRYFFFWAVFLYKFYLIIRSSPIDSKSKIKENDMTYKPESSCVAIDDFRLYMVNK